MRIEPGEFRARPLRVHALLHDVPLEDAWAVPLSGGGAGRTIADVRAVMVAGRGAVPAVVRGLFRLRGRIGALFGWDRRRPAWQAESFADRLSPADRARSLVAPGTPDGSFSLLYRFEDEQLSELRNATVHAFAPFRRLVVYPAVIRKTQSRGPSAMAQTAVSRVRRPCSWRHHRAPSTALGRG